MNTAIRHTLFVLALVAAAPVASADCPNQRAENREGHWVTSTTGSRCRRILSVFGMTIGLGSSSCPDAKFYYPPRRDCIAVPNSNTDCETVGQVAILAYTCACSTIVELDLGIMEQDCTCTQGANAGLFDDHETVGCAE